jgi:hypothetical protein
MPNANGRPRRGRDEVSLYTVIKAAEHLTGEGITPAYRELVGMRTDITRAVTRIEVIDSRNADSDKLHADHEGRLRTLERFRFTLLGAAVAASALVSAAGTWIGFAMTHH